ncbi:MAG: hypothetical protein ACE5KH_02745 [Candidatus Geothermarchaeales archaeon]
MYAQLDGHLNALLHPFSPDVSTVALDALLHAVVERDPVESAGKFVRYNLLYVLRHLKRG